MGTELFTNDATTAVLTGGTTAPASGTVETWTVASSAGFPAATTASGTQFHVADPAPGMATEKVLVTNVSGNTWTVTRGDEGTTPLAHAALFTVRAVVTSGFLNRVPVPVASLGAGVDNSVAINAALAANPGGVVQLAGSSYGLAFPILVPNGTVLRGQTPATQAGDQTGVHYGTTLVALASFANTYGGSALPAYAANARVAAATGGTVANGFTGTFSLQGGFCPLQPADAFPASGTFTTLLSDGTTTATVTYAGRTLTTLTGCVCTSPVSGSLTFVTGNTVTATAANYGQGALVWLLDIPSLGQGATVVSRCTVADMFLDVSAAPAGIDAVATWGDVRAARLTGLGINKPTGNGIASYPNQFQSNANPSDGWTIRDVIIEKGKYHGIWGFFQDTTFDNCHPQQCAQSGWVGDGWMVTWSHNVFVNPRSDLNQWGITIVAKGAETSGAYFSSAVAAGGGTQRNLYGDVRCVNQDSSGQQQMETFKWTGGSLEGAGRASVTTLVAAGSNGGQVSNVASWSSPSAGVLAVASTTGFAATGTVAAGTQLYIPTASGIAQVTYTGLTSTTFTGCAYVNASQEGPNSNGLLTTGAQVTQNPGVAVLASGRCQLTIDCNVQSYTLDNNYGAPHFALQTQSQGTGPGYPGVVDFKAAFCNTTLAFLNQVNSPYLVNVDIRGGYGVGPYWNQSATPPYRWTTKPAVTQTSAYQALLTDDYIAANPTGGAFSITLPPAWGLPETGRVLYTAPGVSGQDPVPLGFTLTIVNVGSANAVGIVTYPGDGTKVNGSAQTWYLSEQWAGATIRWNGSNWNITGMTGLGTLALPVSLNPADPTGTSSTGLVMMGLAAAASSPWVYTPLSNGLVRAEVSGYPATATGAAAVSVGARYGTAGGPATTVAAGSNGAAAISTIATWAQPSAGVLDVASTAGYPASGTIWVTTSGASQPAQVAYTSITGGGTPSFNGCTFVQGTGANTVATGNAVTSVPQNGALAASVGTDWAPSTKPQPKGGSAGAETYYRITKRLALPVGSQTWFDVPISTGNASDAATIVANVGDFAEWS
ncbi:MAG TPA: hypothetical protein VGS19_29180 [Streptosporangiaceae bacterium]|nr:hypothetical protein [Streptosporangiaceae bacterium]